MLKTDLFSPQEPQKHQAIGEQAWLMGGYALADCATMLEAVHAVLRALPPRQMYTPTGQAMSARLSQCGRYGWVSDELGYRYSERDPLTGRCWPAMPERLRAFAQQAAQEAGFANFAPDTCLINAYTPGTKMGLHQDKHEHPLTEPIVSVSFGMSAIFLFGGQQRSDPVDKHLLYHGDVVVWGGADRLRYHGIAGLTGLPHPELGAQRINLTFRRAR